MYLSVTARPRRSNIPTIVKMSGHHYDDPATPATNAPRPARGKTTALRRPLRRRTADNNNSNSSDKICYALARHRLIQTMQQNVRADVRTTSPQNDATKRRRRRPKASLKVAERRKSPTSIRTKLFDRPL